MLTLKEMIQLTSGLQNEAVNLDVPIHGFAIDSRAIKSDNIFVALKGETYHGSAFAKHAIDKGALAVLTDVPLYDTLIPTILVPDSLVALGQIAAHQRNRFKGQVCGVTGTAGKTSVKEALRFLLSQVGIKVYASEKNYNNHIGVPLTLANLDLDAQIAIIEMGMNHPGEILPLTLLSAPHVAIVTSVGPGHIEFFESLKDIALEKASIASGLCEKGVAIFPKDSEFFQTMAQLVQDTGHTLLSFGDHAQSDAQVLHIGLNNTGALCISARILDITVSYSLPTANYAWGKNSLAILAALYALGYDIQELALKFPLLSIEKGRGRRYTAPVAGKNITLIDDAYNANPLSMTAALEALARYVGRKIAVIGDMRELGRLTEKYHVAIAQLCNQLNIDKVLTCGKFMGQVVHHLDPLKQLGHVDTYTDVLPMILNEVKEGDVILFKASNGVMLHHVVSHLLTHEGHPTLTPMGETLP